MARQVARSRHFPRPAVRISEVQFGIPINPPTDSIIALKIAARNRNARGDSEKLLTGCLTGFFAVAEGSFLENLPEMPEMPGVLVREEKKYFFCID